MQRLNMGNLRVDPIEDCPSRTCCDFLFRNSLVTRMNDRKNRGSKLFSGLNSSNYQQIHTDTLDERIQGCQSGERQRERSAQRDVDVNPLDDHCSTDESFLEHCIVDLDDYDTNESQDCTPENDHEIKGINSNKEFRCSSDEVESTVSKVEGHGGIPKYIYIDLSKSNDVESLDDCSYERRHTRRFSRPNDTILDAYSEHNIRLYGSKEIPSVLKGVLEKDSSVENSKSRDGTTCTTVESSLIAV